LLVKSAFNTLKSHSVVVLYGELQDQSTQIQFFWLIYLILVLRSVTYKRQRILVLLFLFFTVKTCDAVSAASSITRFGIIGIIEFWLAISVKVVRNSLYYGSYNGWPPCACEMLEKRHQLPAPVAYRKVEGSSGRANGGLEQQLIPYQERSTNM